MRITKGVRVEHVHRVVQRTVMLMLVIAVAAAVAVAAALAVSGHQPLVVKNASARAHAAATHNITVTCPAAAASTSPTFTAALLKCRAKVPAGPRGRRGARGARGARGPAGPAGHGTPFVYRATAGTTTPTTVFTGDGLTIQASCLTASNGPVTNGGSPQLNATTATNGASIGEVTGEYDQYGNSNTDEKFDVGETFQINYADDAPNSVSQSGTFTYVNAAGQVVTGNFLAMGTGVRSNDTAPNDCVIAGTISAP